MQFIGAMASPHYLLGGVAGLMFRFVGCDGLHLLCKDYFHAENVNQFVLGI